RARYYHPGIGRFLQPDPINVAGGINIYTYCGNNSMMFIDPWGLCKNDLKDTRGIVNRIAATWHPLLHAFPPSWGGYDYRQTNDSFTIMENGQEVSLSGSEFGNYLAGFMGQLHLGATGAQAMYRAGDWYAGVDKGGSWTRYYKLHFGTDDPESVRDIGRGIKDAKDIGLIRKTILHGVHKVIYDW
ncbi:MAG: RHS repeat-associated core domain-containing protein, partial [Phycisphaerae bacterium]|nr:RHS repeat-associated core domain-containing protein [Phycisphaerae bacterium]